MYLIPDVTNELAFNSTVLSKTVAAVAWGRT